VQYPFMKRVGDLAVGDVIEGKAIVISPTRPPTDTEDEERDRFVADRRADESMPNPTSNLVEFELMGAGYDAFALGFEEDPVEITAQITGDLLHTSGLQLTTLGSLLIKAINENTQGRGGSIVMTTGDITLDAFIEVGTDVSMQVTVKSEGIVLDFTDACQNMVARSQMLYDAAQALAREAGARAAAGAQADVDEDPLFGIKGPKL
jgi:hypothetical protein